jgi:SAM-dependent methyltransferase
MSHVPDLVARISSQSRLHQAFFAKALGGLGPGELADLEGYVGHCLAEGATLDVLAGDYKLVVDDTLREQVYFWRHGRYRYARYDEVAGAVYQDPRYMTAYMRGLALTAFFWPNHARIRRWFEEHLPPRPETRSGRYLEVGPGHGFHFVAALRRAAFEACEGVDISPSSVELTRRLLAEAGFAEGPRVRLRVADFLAADLEPGADMLVMGEVLEHVERPDLFLARARELTHARSTLFVTTCANSPAFDHIYLFRSPDEVEALAQAAGLAVSERLVLPYDGTSLEESLRRRLPINVALVLRHA